MHEGFTCEEYDAHIARAERTPEAGGTESTLAMIRYARMAPFQQKKSSILSSQAGHATQTACLAGTAEHCCI